jgi:signal transduction histidine kinase
MHSRARDMNASLKIESEPGKGTTIYLSMPIP